MLQRRAQWKRLRSLCCATADEKMTAYLEFSFDFSCTKTNSTKKTRLEANFWNNDYFSATVSFKTIKLLSFPCCCWHAMFRFCFFLLTCTFTVRALPHATPSRSRTDLQAEFQVVPAGGPDRLLWSWRRKFRQVSVGPSRKCGFEFAPTSLLACHHIKKKNQQLVTMAASVNSRGSSVISITKVGLTAKLMLGKKKG